MTHPLHWSLVRGPLPIVLMAFAVVAFAVLSADRSRSWNWKAPTALAVAALLAALLGVYVDQWWRPFPEGLPHVVLLWIGIAILGVAVAVLRLPALSWRRRAGAVACAAVVTVACANEINGVFQYYPTPRAMLGQWLDHGTKFDTAAGHRTELFIAPPGQLLADAWKPPGNLPATGTLSQVTIPGTASHFSARKAWIYLPPAYRASPRPQLPLLVLVAGQPGTPRDWIDAVNLPKIMDDYAAAHYGLAPVVVMPDATGTPLGNTLCMDSKLGNAETYLTTDLKAWAAANLQVDPPGQGWTIGGFSFGGTCSLQLAVRASSTYHTFLDVSGQREPTLGNHRDTVKRAFGGDEAAFARADPMSILTTRRFPELAGRIVSGSSDREYTPGLRVVYSACKQAGIDVEMTELPGGHTWQVPRGALTQQLSWIAERSGLARR